VNSWVSSFRRYEEDAILLIERPWIDGEKVKQSKIFFGFPGGITREFFREAN
jgi:hypothetical protein